MNDKVESGRIIPNDFGKLKPLCSDKDIEYLKNSLKVLEHGRPETFAFPLYGTRGEKVFDDWIAIVEKSPLPDFIKEYERSRLKKVGLQGGVPSWDKLKDLFELYYTAPKPVSYVDTDIMKQMLKDYSALYCRKMSASEALAHLKRTDKIETRAAGWNQFSLKKTDPSAQQEALRFAKSGLWKQGYGYTFARYNKLKYRLFMPMPYSSMIKQSQYFIDFLAKIQKDLLLSEIKSPYLGWSDKIGFANCFRLMEQVIQKEAITSDETLIYFSNDFEKMDTRTATAQYESIFIPVLNAAFHSQDPELRQAMLFTTTAPIISPSGTLIGNHGTASGAEVTNGGESVCNDYFQRRFLKLLIGKIPVGLRLIWRCFNGDDSGLIFALKEKTCAFADFKTILLDSLKQTCDETGFDIQFDKLDISKDFGKYCQNIYYYDRNNNRLVWMYPTVLALNSIVHPEHQYTPAQWDKDYRDLDIIQKSDNVAGHPLFEQFVSFIMKGTKYPLLGRNERETQRILSKYDNYRALQSLGERYNRQDYKISDSPSVKYILNQR